MDTVELKSWPAFFSEILAGRRTSDIRAMDREYRVGQHLLLREYDPFVLGGSYTGRSCLVEVTHITSRDTPCALSSVVLHHDYCVLSIKRVDDFHE